MGARTQQAAGEAAREGFQVIVAATTAALAIGKNGRLPWRLPGDLEYFKKVTMGSACIMGRKTWESIPAKHRPLRGRVNIVVSSQPSLEGPDRVCGSLEEALEAARLCGCPEPFVIGGSRLYAEAVADARCRRVYMTAIEDRSVEAGCDAFFPTLRASEFRQTTRSEARVENGLEYRFEVYERLGHAAAAVLGDKTNVPATRPLAAAAAKNAEEKQYLDLVADVVRRGRPRLDRTGVGTRSIFGATMRFSLRDDVFPLLTTKRVFWRGVAEELLWFLKGSTDARALSAKNVKIWDDNGSRDFLDRRGLPHRRVGDLGPVYGFQWRHFGADYVDCDADYAGRGVDQLRKVMHQITHEPESRRIILTAWNPLDLDKMALPPCHCFAQFYVNDGELSCQMYQRSADLGLGVPFNIASYALLTRLIAHCCNLKPGDFVHVIGDAHVYLSHIDALNHQLQRTPRPFPTLTIHPDKRDIDHFQLDDFTLHDYRPYPAIKMDMAV